MTGEALRALLESMTLEEKAGQLIQCNAGQFIANELEITGQVHGLHYLKFCRGEEYIPAF